MEQCVSSIDSKVAQKVSVRKSVTTNEILGKLAAMNVNVDAAAVNTFDEVDTENKKKKNTLSKLYRMFSSENVPDSFDSDEEDEEAFDDDFTNIEGTSEQEEKVTNSDSPSKSSNNKKTFSSYFYGTNSSTKT